MALSEGRPAGGRTTVEIPSPRPGSTSIVAHACRPGSSRSWWIGGKVYAPEKTAERVQLLLEAVAALVKAGREPRTMRWIVRALLTQNLEARLPDDETLRGIPIRRFRARLGMGASDRLGTF